MLALKQTEWYEQLNHPNNPAFSYIRDERLQQETWNIEQCLPSLAEEARSIGRRTINFKEISLPWLKQLTKLVVLVAVSNRRWSLSRVKVVLGATIRFNTWLCHQGYVTPSILSVYVVQQWMQNQNVSHTQGIQGLLSVLKQLGCVKFQVKFQNRATQSKPPKIIAEDIKYKLDQALKELDNPIFLAVKLHETLGTRSIEIAKIPLECLRRREGVARIRLFTAKQDDSRQEQDLPEELVPLVLEQQAFIRQKFGNDFPWLFAKWEMKRGFQNKDWPPTFKFHQEQIKDANGKLNLLLKRLIEKNDIRTSNGELAHVTTHQFRRTYATIADRMGKRPDQIQYGLRQANSVMQDSYVYVPPEQQEKRTERVLVNKDGRRSNYRTNQDSEFFRREWTARQVEVGVCTRPTIMKACEFEYVCLGCQHVRFALEHLPQLIKIRDANQNLLERSLKVGQSDSRRAHSARQLISVLNPIIVNLQKA